MRPRSSHLNGNETPTAAPGMHPVVGLVIAVLAISALLASCVSPAARRDGSPSRAREPEPILGAARQLTFEGRRTGEGYFSRDGDQLVFQSEREPGNPFYQIYVMNQRDGHVLRASTGVGKTTCGWLHPSGGRVLFASTHLDPASAELQEQEYVARAHDTTGRRYAWDFDKHFDLFSVRLPDSPAEGARVAAIEEEPRALTAVPGYDAEASWSPDGRQIVFASNRHIYDADGSLSSALTAEERKRAETDLSYFVELYSMDARSGHVQRLTLEPGYDGGPFFSPDGKRIVFRRFSEDGATAEIFTMRTDGTDMVQLTQLGALSWAPFYHPSGDFVIFATNLHGFANFELYLVRSDGEGKPVRVTDSEGFDGLPAFSPDGAQLAFTRKPPGGQSQLYVAPFSETRAREQLALRSKSFHGVGPLLPVPARLSPEIRSEDLRAFVEALSSEQAAGRMTGTAGERIATSYVARSFRALDLAPGGDAAGYFQQFGFTAGVSLGTGNRLEATSSTGGQVARHPDGSPLRIDHDYRPLAFSKVGRVPPSPIVFAGYGIVAPAHEAEGEGETIPAVDAYADLDVAGRWVMMLRYLPEDLEPEARRHYARHSSLRYKAMVARDRGAVGVLFVSGPHSDVRSELVKLRSDASLSGTSIAVVSLSNPAAQALLQAADAAPLAKLQAALDNLEGGPLAEGFALDNVLLEAKIDIQQQRKKGRNVIARLPATHPTDPPLPALLIGAHVDHLGTGGTDSMARGGERNAIHPGADDNASGVAALLEIAGSLAEARDSGRWNAVRDIVFAAWSGEELGLLGSSAYAKAEIEAEAEARRARGEAEQGEAQPKLPERIAAYLNMDMVGRLRNEVAMFGVDSSPVWPREIERRNVPIGLRIRPKGDNFLPTDATTFFLGGVPALSAFTGAHDAYHTPRDLPETLNYEGIADIAKLIGEIAASLATDPISPTFVESTESPSGLPRAGLRVYLGTIPDYAQQDGAGRGVLLSGVSAGGPAALAGLRAGDLIIAVGEQRIENIYDYTYALDGLKVGVEVEIVVVREGREQRLTLTPASRD